MIIAHSATAEHAAVDGSTGTRSAVLHSSALTIACLVSYVVIADALDAVHSISHADSYLGGMWATIATVFVYRIGYQESVKAALTRTYATLLSFALCLAYLLVLPFHPLGMSILIGLGALILMMAGRDEDVVTAGITTAVVMVVAGLAPTNAWQQPILRLVDTAVGMTVGLAAARAARELASGEGHIGMRRAEG